MASHDWAAAYELLRPLLDADTADPDDLGMLEEASWWTGHIDDAISAGEAAVAGYSKQGHKEAAARVAVSVAEHYAQRLQPSLARGWVKRARRLLEGSERSPAMGHLLRLESQLVGDRDDGLSQALNLVVEVQEIGAEVGDLDLEMLGMHDRGRYLVYLGDVETGMGMMEEALVSAVSGELSPQVTGRILCNTIEVTSATADYRRATEWSDQAMRWCETMGSAGGYPGACRVRRSEFMRLRGAWPAAEAEATKAAGELVDIGPYQAQAFNELGMIRLATGDLHGADDAFQKAHSLGLSPMPGLALLAMRRGEVASAWSMIDTALTRTDDYLARAKLIPAAVEIGLAADHADDARVLASELAVIAERYGSELLEIFAEQAEGRIAAHQGDHDAAIGPLSDVVTKLVSWGLPYEAARARCDLGMTLIGIGSDTLGWLEINEAKSEFGRLGAASDVEHLARLLDRGDPGEPRPKLKTMMFTDIVDSTRLVDLIGDESWADLVAWHDRTIRSLLAEHRGEEVDHAGDGFFVSFESPFQAVACAGAIQGVLQTHRKEAGFSPAVRIGIHAGEVLEAGDGLVGHEVHLAARVATAAEGGQVLVSDATAAGLADGFRFADPVLVEGKGISEPIAVRALLWRG